MNSRTTLFLFLLVALLGGAVWWQTQREERGEFEFMTPLFEGLDPQRLSAIRLDNLERSIHIKFERTPGRRWVITDPISYPADESILRVLIEAVTNNLAIQLAEAELPLVQKSFDPPRAQLEVSERFADGSERKTLIELGALDIDGRSVLIRKDGKYWKTLRNLDTCLQHELNRFRAKELYDIDVRDVVQIRRTGEALLGGQPTSVNLSLERRGLDWRVESPMRVLADPGSVKAYLLALTTTQVEKFMSEDISFAKNFGLDPPELRIELSTSHGESQTVCFGRTSEASQWFACRESFPYIWMLEEGVGPGLLLQPSRFFNLEFVHTIRSAVERVELEDGGRALRIERDGEDWKVCARRDPEGAWSEPVPAEKAKVGDLLSRLENVRLTRYLLEATPEEAFGQAQPERSLHVTQVGQRSGGRVGAHYRSEQGSEALYFQRDEDRLIGLLPLEFESIFDSTLASLRSSHLWDLEEVDQQSLSISHDGQQRRFRHARGGTWQYLDMDAEARELRPVLDSLIFLRATEFSEAPASELAQLQDPIEVEIVDRRGVRHAARIGLGPGGALWTDVAGTRAKLADQKLHAHLLEILAMKDAGG